MIRLLALTCKLLYPGFSLKDLVVIGSGVEFVKDQTSPAMVGLPMASYRVHNENLFVWSFLYRSFQLLKLAYNRGCTFVCDSNDILIFDQEMLLEVLEELFTLVISLWEIW